MTKLFKTLTALALALLIACAGFAFAEDEETPFTLWKADAPALNALIGYVEAVTDEESPDYIPEYDRIAVFDMDGTLMGELYPTYLEYYMLAWRILKDPDIHPDSEMLEVGRTLRDCALDNSFPSDMPMQHALQAARAYAGMSLFEFEDFVNQILLREADGFEGMTYGEAFYLPMVEVIEYLQDNGFTWTWSWKPAARVTWTDWTTCSPPPTTCCARTGCSSRTSRPTRCSRSPRRSAASQCSPSATPPAT